MVSTANRDQQVMMELKEKQGRQERKEFKVSRVKPDHKDQLEKQVQLASKDPQELMGLTENKGLKEIQVILDFKD